MLEIAFAQAALPESGALVLLVAQADAASADAAEAETDNAGAVPVELGGLGSAADAATDGAIARALATGEFKGKKAQSVTLLSPGGARAPFSRVVAIGLGKPADLDAKAAGEAGGHAALALAREPAAAIAAVDLPPELAAEVAFGAVLRAYRFDRYRTTEKADEKPRLAKLTVLTGDVAAAEAAWTKLKGVAEGVFVSRDLVSEPPNVLNPPEMARRCEALSKLGLEVEVFGPAQLAELGFGALLGVAQGSANEARMVVMQWKGGETGAPVAFIGKGVTFDTGGISIKPAGGMEDMKWDMAGAGCVVGLMAALAGRKARVNAVGLVGLVENMPDGNAQRPGDVVKTASGQTVEIINTDAEGRMVLADVLWYCQKRFEPKFMIDLATLTGAMIVALGHEYAGFFCNDDTLAGQLSAAGEATGEKLWRFPLAEAYDKALKSEIADMKHVGGRPGGAITAAHFIQRFVNKKTWAHLDIAGTAWATKDSAIIPKGATAYGVRLLDRLVADHYES
jgi:leucyl aminopeptidase